MVRNHLGGTKRLDDDKISDDGTGPVRGDDSGADESGRGGALYTMDGCKHAERIEKEIAWCMTYDQAEECKGAGGQKLRRVCIWCDKYKRKEEQKDETGN